ncbi:MAG TPA: hypothetical protein VM243_05110 [Phycisphaerae bacterium]|nr:hypothetical protein [Phycisphaerae bacterium]
MTEQQKALSLVNLLRFSAPKADVVPDGIRTAYMALLTAYRALSASEQERVFLRARFDAAPPERRNRDLADPDLLVTARYGATAEERIAAAKQITAARRSAAGLEPIAEPVRPTRGVG